MKRRTSANTRAPRNVAVLLALLAIAFTCCWMPTASAQTIGELMPDANLRSQLGLQPAANLGDLRSLGAVHNLSATSSTDPADRIKDLTGLEHIVGLRIIHLRYHDISDLTPLQNQTGLESLSLNDNEVSDLTPLQNLTDLTRLDLSDNEVSNLTPLQNLMDLETLVISGNEVRDLTPLQNLTNLRELEAQSNQIIDISPLRGLINLRRLRLAGNEIRDISPIAEWTHIPENWRTQIAFSLYWGRLRLTNPLSYLSIYTHIGTLIGENVGLYANWNVFPYFNADGILRAPTTLDSVSAADQTVRFGDSPSPLVVRVLDQNGEPFAAVPVVFAVTAGDGTVETAETATHDPTYDRRYEEEGKAMTTFTVGTAVGEQKVVATVTHKATDETRAAGYVIEDTTLEATFTINVLPIALNVLPSALDASTVAPAHPTALQVNWQAPAYAIQNYEVRYRVADSEAWTTSAYKGTEPSTTLTDLIPGTTYEWQVRAQTTAGPSPWSPSQRATTGYVLVQTRELSPSPVASDRLVFNELRNADDDTHDWLELKNISDADIALADWEISIVAQPGGGTPQDKAIADFPDATLPAGEVLLIVNTDPRQTDLAGGVDIKTGLGKRGARHRYFVAADLKLPSSPYLLLLRSATDKNGTPDAVEDIAGNYFRETGDLSYGDAGTQVWPLQDTARPLPADTALLTAGEAWARVSTETRGYLAAAWGKSGHQAGLGYQQNVVASETSLGTPGYANAAIVVEAPSGRVSISEIMLATKAGRRTVPQWIELYNNSTTEAVKLEGWRLEIEYLKGEGARRHRFDEVSLTPLTVLPNQTVLLATWRAETSGHFPEGKVYNLYFEHPNAFNQRERRNDVLNAAGFSVRLSDASGTLVDSVGNLDGVARTKDTPMWEVPSGTTAEDARASLIRQYEDSAPLPGTDAAGWKSAANVKLAVSTYYGWETDIGTPGYREGGPLPVVLSHFQSVRTDTGVVIRWTTESSVDNAGFNILRSESLSGPFTKINPALIAGSGTTGESSAYLFTDGAAKPGVVYYYRLEEVSLRGVHQSLATTRVRGHVSASGKRITRWSELKSPSSR